MEHVNEFILRWKNIGYKQTAISVFHCFYIFIFVYPVIYLSMVILPSPFDLPQQGDLIFVVETYLRLTIEFDRGQGGAFEKPSFQIPTDWGGQQSIGALDHNALALFHTVLSLISNLNIVGNHLIKGILKWGMGA